jgi:hypothetical protein
MFPCVAAGGHLDLPADRPGLVGVAVLFCRALQLGALSVAIGPSAEKALDL